MRLLGHQHLLLLEEQGLAVGLKDQPLGKAGKSSLVPARSPPPPMGRRPPWATPCPWASTQQPTTSERETNHQQPLTIE